jgi:CRP/FNR family transcriptional regulator
MGRVIPIESKPGEIFRLEESLATLVLQRLNSQKACNHVTLGAGQTLFREGNQPRAVSILLEGQIKLSTDSADGKRLILFIAEPEAVLGLAAALTGMPYEMTAETIYPCRLMALQIDSFLDVLRSSPQALSVAARELGLHFSRACKHLQMVSGTQTVITKLARLLLEWSESGCETERGVKIHIGRSHKEIGEFIGASRESVTRTLGEFKRRNVIEVGGSLLTITNFRALEGYAGVPIF